MKLDSHRRIALFLTISRIITLCKIHRILRAAYLAFFPSYTLEKYSLDLFWKNNRVALFSVTQTE